MNGGNGVVYIASSDDLNGVEIVPANHFAHYEFEVAFRITPLRFADRASICIPASEARRILNGMQIQGLNISSIIRSDDGVSSILERLTPLDEWRISMFVALATVSPRC